MGQKAGQRVANSGRAVCHPCEPRRTAKTFRGHLVCSSTESPLPRPLSAARRLCSETCSADAPASLACGPMGARG
jgi:hypothetical protein